MGQKISLTKLLNRDTLTILIKGFILLSQGFLVILLELDAFCDFESIEGRLHSLLHDQMGLIISNGQNKV